MVVGFWTAVVKDGYCSDLRHVTVRCPEGYVDLVKTSDHCYKFHTRRMGYIQARAACISDYATLVEPKNPEESTKIFEYIVKEYGGFWNTWIGSRITCKVFNWCCYVVHFHDMCDSGDGKNYAWESSGKLIDYSPWAPNQPNNAQGIEGCAQFINNEGQWGDKPCFLQLRYMCMKRKG